MRLLPAIVMAAAAMGSSSAMAQSASNGNTLYHTYCVSCHGDPPAGGPEVATSGDFIANQIRTNPSMQFLQSDSHFTPANIAASTNDIYAYLLTLRPAPPPPVTANTPGPLSGLFYNAQESGWGIHLTQRGTNVFAAWYTYDTSGNPKWYVSTCAMAGGTTGTTGTCSGQFFEVSGPRFFGVPFNTSQVTPVANGNLQLTFSGADNAQMTYTGVAGQTRSVAIVRQPLASGAIPDVNYTDIWWNAPANSESGWGIAITQQATTVFLAWYVYDNSGKPTWYVALCTLSGTTCPGNNNVLAVHGPAFGPTFDSHQVTSAAVGSLSVTFTDPNNATLNYIVNGVSGTKQITRQIF